MRIRPLFALTLFAVAGCAADVCSDIECVMAHMTISINGEAAPLVAVPADALPTPSSLPQTMSAGDFQLLITPLSAPNWGDPIELIQAGGAAQGPSSASAALAPSITNHPNDLSLLTPSSTDTLTLIWIDPNAALPAFCFSPYTKALPYPHCVWCTTQERDMANAGVANMRAGINAGIISPIDFSSPTGQACKNPTRPNGTSANPMRGCPTGTVRCGDGCMPASGVCCQSPVGDTTSYCTNSAGGGCRVGVACAGAQNCCDSTGSFGSVDCGPNERHCGLSCVSRDRPCCPIGSTDPQCVAQAPLFAGAGVGVGVQAPPAPAANGGGGGGGGGGGNCDYSGTYKGVFTYSWHGNNIPETQAQLTMTFTIKSQLAGMAAVAGADVLKATAAQVDDPTFGATASITPRSDISVSEIPCDGPAQQGNGFAVFFPNGSHVATFNELGPMQISADRRTFTNIGYPAASKNSWIGGGTFADSNADGSGPGGHVYNATTFLTYIITKQ